MKKPSFQFYPGDFSRDFAVRSVSLAARGLWIEMLCLMHQSERRGYLEVGGFAPSMQQLSRMVGADHKEISKLLEELRLSSVFSEENDVIFCRRMVRDTAKEVADRVNGAMGGNPTIKAIRVKGGVNPLVNGEDKSRGRASSVFNLQSSILTPQRATRDETAYPAPADGPDPAELVRLAVEQAAKTWHNIGDKRWARGAWELEAAASAKGVADWCNAIVATAAVHGAAHIAARVNDRRHFIPTLEKWVSSGDYTSPPPNVIRTYIGPIDLGEDLGLGGKKNGV